MLEDNSISLKIILVHIVGKNYGRNWKKNFGPHTIHVINLGTKTFYLLYIQISTWYQFDLNKNFNKPSVFIFLPSCFSNYYLPNFLLECFTFFKKFVYKSPNYIFKTICFLFWSQILTNNETYSENQFVCLLGLRYYNSLFENKFVKQTGKVVSSHYFRAHLALQHFNEKW